MREGGSRRREGGSRRREGLTLQTSLLFRSSFSCNRVRTIEVKKWVIKEFDNVPVASQNVGMFFSNEAYVIRWGYQISVSGQYLVICDHFSEMTNQVWT